ncbi:MULTISPECIES: S8 family serine peptidase [unclassified Halomonas]|uniref:S8 family serine peptidase n=1 Tax=unclassified Halomonas TaxID=2609666 RepID=UPI0007D9A08B|nr:MULTISPECIES: S8 family serine peptidase [unclassified Halomonas]MBT2788230.1 S8 family serine peptidase [Halomonas sp. ISL-106]MBT2795979.1 S8 family serine peptidase [Halomonas sp. ISL-104]OAL61251.1 peptidase S8 [Halomonas sp. ALS9]
MAKTPKGTGSGSTSPGPSGSLNSVSCSTEKLLLAALERGGSCLETGRFLISYREGRVEEGIKALKAQNFRVADARDFTDQAVSLEDTGDAEALVFPELGVALVGGDALEQHGMSVFDKISADSPIEIIEPEYFAFSENSDFKTPDSKNTSFKNSDSRNADYLRGFLRAASTIACDLGVELDSDEREESHETDAPEVTWGLAQCKVPQSRWSGAGIKVAVLDTGMDLGHPDYAGREFVTRSFVGEPVQDLNGHGTHCIGTACGPKAPSESTSRYGIAFDAQVLVGKVLTNSGSSTGAGVLAGLNWAIANRCEVISMSLGSQSPVQAAYTHAGAAALRNGCLIIAAAGNSSASTGAPANSPTVMSVASLDANLKPSSFSNHGKIEIAAPGRDIFSSWPRPTRHKTISGTSMAAPHVAGCAALWAQSDASLRGMKLWQQLVASVKGLPSPEPRVGAGLVQAP